MRYCGRNFTPEEIEIIRRIIREDPNRSRACISRLVCHSLRWLKINGSIKDMSCRVALLRMEKDGLIRLPPPRPCPAKESRAIQYTSATDPDVPVRMRSDLLPEITLQRVANPGDSRLWNEFIDRYHYLKYKPLPGAQLRYIASCQGLPLALLGFGAAAWKVAPRDHFIGWSDEQRRQHLHLVVNNARFLILPWVQSPNLASSLLAMVTRNLPDDWHKIYGYRPLLFETFVETKRFHGTCYKAANWIYVGQTQGRGKLDVHHQATLPAKDIWLYPLSQRFRKLLSS